MIMGDTFDRPVHTVCVDDFYIGKYEMTVGEFREFVNKTGYKTEAEADGGCLGVKEGIWKRYGDLNWHNPGFKQTDKDPVVCVNWNDSHEFIKWKSRITGKNYRLPLEAEWEYAARNRGKIYKDSWAGRGNGQPSENVSDESQKRAGWGTVSWEGYDDGYTFTAPVGSFRPNELGLYDMTGNVAEWVQDWYGEDYYMKSPKDNPKGPNSGEEAAPPPPDPEAKREGRVIRGCSWEFSPMSVCASWRIGGDPTGTDSDIGFRLAASPK